MLSLSDLTRSEKDINTAEEIYQHSRKRGNAPKCGRCLRPNLYYYPEDCDHRFSLLKGPKCVFYALMASSFILPTGIMLIFLYGLGTVLGAMLVYHATIIALLLCFTLMV